MYVRTNDEDNSNRQVLLLFYAVIVDLMSIMTNSELYLWIGTSVETHAYLALSIRLRMAFAAHEIKTSLRIFAFAFYKYFMFSLSGRKSGCLINN